MFGRKCKKRSRKSSEKPKKIKGGTPRYIEVMSTKMSRDLSVFQLKGVMLLRPEHRRAAWECLIFRNPETDHIYWVRDNVPELADRAKVELANRLRVIAFQQEEERRTSL